MKKSNYNEAPATTRPNIIHLADGWTATQIGEVDFQGRATFECKGTCPKCKGRSTYNAFKEVSEAERLLPSLCAYCVDP